MVCERPPVRSIKGASRHFLGVASTPPRRGLEEEGNIPCPCLTTIWATTPSAVASLSALRACNGPQLPFRLPLFGCSHSLAGDMKLSFGVAIFLGAAILAAQQNSSPAAAGEALFFGKAGCASCHEVNGRGGVTGPDLSAAGQAASETLRAKILNPNNSTQTPPGGRGAPLTIVAKMKDGREIQGVRRNEDTFTLQIVDASGQLHLLDKMKLA